VNTHDMCKAMKVEKTLVHDLPPADTFFFLRQILIRRLLLSSNARRW